MPSITRNSTNLFQSIASVFDIFSSLDTQPSGSDVTVNSTTQLSTFSGVSSFSTPTTPNSSTSSSVNTSPTSLGISPALITDVQPSVTLTYTSTSTVLPVSPPSSSCYACPTVHYVDVHAKNVFSTIANFSEMIPNSCSTNGFSYEYPSDWNDEQVGYNITITPIPSCAGLSTSTCENPLPDFNSSENLWGAWRNCKWYQHRGQSGDNCFQVQVIVAWAGRWKLDASYTILCLSPTELHILVRLCKTLVSKHCGSHFHARDSA